MTGRWRQLRFAGLLGVLAVFLLMSGALFAERSGIQVSTSQTGPGRLPRTQTLTAAQVMADRPARCLLLWHSGDENSCTAAQEFPPILQDMKVGYTAVDLSAGPLPALDGYSTVVVTLSDLTPLGEQVLTLSEWVAAGGRVLFASALQKNACCELVEGKLGILSSGYNYAMVDSVRPGEDFMAGGGQVYGIADGFDSAWVVELGESAQVMMTTGDGKNLPLVWRTAYGDGCFVVVNLGFCEKATRGFYAAAYSLLEPVCAWPVLDGAVFYLDDFPSPVPAGDGDFISRDYGLSVAEFYTNVWWPDMLALARQYGFAFTGVVIENYEDETEEPPARQSDTARFQYFGNMLLRAGGEIGWHGYNHQPLCTGTTDYAGTLPYHTWPDEDAMADAMQELLEFVDEQFPEGEKGVYVPPSNVLSAEGRQLLAARFPQVHTIASSYFEGDFAYAQEFGVADDGMVEQPRVTSGEILDDFTRMTALSELNFHFVSNHFLHPDDLLDEDRGAALGWEELKRRLTEFMDWLYTAAPQIRRMTGSELSGAIQRFARLTVDAETDGETVTLRLGNFVDEASLLVRFNEGTPVRADGGELTPVTGTLYLLRASRETVTIQLEGNT